MLDIFKLKKLNTNFKTELLAGLTTFLTMSYVIILNPKILSGIGISFESAFLATVLTACIGSLALGLFAKLPFAIASYIGESAFVAYIAFNLLGFEPKQIFGTILLCAILLFVLTIFNIRTYIVNSIPISIKLAFTAGLGMFLSFIALLNMNIVLVHDSSCPLKIGSFNNLEVLLAFFNIALIIILMSRKVKAAILISIITTTILGWGVGLVKLPEQIVALPNFNALSFCNADITSIFSINTIPLVITILIMMFIDTAGSLIGVSYQANILDENKNLPDIKKPMLVDSFTSIIAALTGTVTNGVYLDSVTGVKAGGKSGLTAIVFAVLMFLGLFFYPIISALPPFTYSGALFVIGILMMNTLKELPIDDYTEYFPAILSIMFIVFTFNVGIGIAVSFISYPLLKLFAGRVKETNIAQWVLFILSVLFFAFLPA